MANNRRNKNKQPNTGDDDNRCWDFVLYLLIFFVRTVFYACIFIFLILVLVYNTPNTSSEKNVEFPVQDDEFSSEIYRSPETFRWDYVEMSLHFKVFVYTEGLEGSVCNYPSELGGKYGIEGHFFKNVREMFSTDDPEEAHMFFVPISCHELLEKGQSQEDMTRTVQNFVHRVITKYPYWNSTLGADHFFVTCHESNITATENVLHLMENSIRVVCSSIHDAKYRPWSDIFLPQIVQHFAFPAGGKYVENRTTLGFWAGRRSSKLRDMLINTWQNDKELDIQSYIVDKNIKGHLLYKEKFLRSKFCICPYASDDHGGRLATVISYGCVPVILSDNYTLPFNHILDWRKFSITLGEKDVYRLKNILKRIPDATYKQMQKNVIRVQKHFEWNSPPVTLDAFHMAMYELWLRCRSRRHHHFDRF